MVLGLLDEKIKSLPILDEQGVGRQIIDDVIEAINRELDSSVLQPLDEADQEKVKSRVHILVGKAYRLHDLHPSAQDHSRMTDEISRRVLGLGFLDLLLQPFRTDLAEITVYSSGLVQVMPKGSVRWETIDLQVDASEVWRIITLLLGGQSKALNEATPSVNARLPATRNNPAHAALTILEEIRQRTGSDIPLAWEIIDKLVLQRKVG
jgi:pilus assembly protein CpaF